jgi:F1F0 ATPase subunit 2
MMISNQWLQLSISFGAGMVIGWLYFTGLWHTVRRLLQNSTPGSAAIAIILFTYLIRLALALVLFYWLALSGIWSLVSGIAGFTLMAGGIALLRLPEKSK